MRIFLKNIHPVQAPRVIQNRVNDWGVWYECEEELGNECHVKTSRIDEYLLLNEGDKIDVFREATSWKSALKKQFCRNKFLGGFSSLRLEYGGNEGNLTPWMWLSETVVKVRTDGIKKWRTYLNICRGNRHGVFWKGDAKLKIIHRLTRSGRRL